MLPKLNRRRFLQQHVIIAGAIATGFGSGHAIEPFIRKAPRLRLGLAAYSFRDSFAAKKMDLFQFIDFCAAHECDGAELTSYYFPESTSQDLLVKLKRHAFVHGVEITGTAVGNTFTAPAGKKRDDEIALVKKWVDHAAVMGAPHIRVFAGNAERQTLDQAKKNCIEALEECCAYAGKKGVVLGIENHGGIVAEAEPLIEIIKAVQSPWIGINLDTGNFHTADPMADLRKCAPYAVNVQIKSEISPKGKQKQQADMAAMIKILREANYCGYVTLEYEAEADPYQTIPGLLKELRKLLG